MAESGIKLAAILERLSSLLLAVPLRFKIMGMVSGITVIFALTTLYIIYGTLLRNMEDLLTKEGHSIAVELAFQAPDYLLINDLYGLTRILKNTVNNRPDLRYAVVTNRTGRVVAHTFGSTFPEQLLTLYQTAEEAAAEVSLRRIPTNEGMVWETGAAIMHGEEGRLRVGVRENAFRRQIDHFIQSFIWNFIWVILVGLLLSVYLTWLITRPINHLLQATRAVNQGEFKVQLPRLTSDEVGTLIDAFNEMTKRLAEAEDLRREKEKIRRDFLQRVIDGQEGERKRIARELHDQTGQALAAVMLQLKMLADNTEHAPTRQSIAELKQTITREMESIHGLAFTLRPSILDDMGLIPALEVFCADLAKRYQLQVTLNCLGFARSRPDSCAETTIYRIVQEALLNVLRHAETKEARVLLSWEGERIRGVVEDEGRGFAPETLKTTQRLGVHGMLERIELINGTFQIESEPGQGTMVAFTIPVEEAPPHA